MRFTRLRSLASTLCVLGYVLLALLMFPERGSTQGVTERESLVRTLDSPDALARMTAFEKLRQLPGALSDIAIRSVLLRLVQRENDLIVATLLASDGHAGVSVKYGEDFGVYESDVWNACWKYCNDREALLDLALRNADNTVEAVRDDALRDLGSFALPNAGYALADRARIDNMLIAATRDPFAPIRQNSVRELGVIARTDRELAPVLKDEIHRTIAASTSDTYMDTRVEAVRALGATADPGDLPLLKRIAAQDTTRHLRRTGQISYPVREAALSAIALISSK